MGYDRRFKDEEEQVFHSQKRKKTKKNEYETFQEEFLTEADLNKQRVNDRRTNKKKYKEKHNRNRDWD